MRLVGLLKKTAIENLRDWKILILTLVFGPFFVVLMYLYLGDTAQPQRSADGQAALTSFALYVPALLALSLIMLMFTASASLIKDKDKGTLVRLRLSNMTALEWYSSVTIVQVIIGLATMVLTFATAIALGYRPNGSLAAMLVVGLVTCLSIIAISLLVAACLRTIFDLLTIGCFPFFILLFFSGGMFPLPSLRLFTIGGHTVNASDLLPTTHTISALGKILNYNAGLGEVGSELAAMLLLTALLYAAGAWLFAWRHLRLHA